MKHYLSCLIYDVTCAYLINIAFPASVLTGSTSFQDSFKVFLVFRDRDMETVLNPGNADKFLKLFARWWNEAEQPIVNAFVIQFLKDTGREFTIVYKYYEQYNRYK